LTDKEWVLFPRGNYIEIRGKGNCFPKETFWVMTGSEVINEFKVVWVGGGLRSIIAKKTTH
jgi:hypothetical protein